MGRSLPVGGIPISQPPHPTKPPQVARGRNPFARGGAVPHPKAPAPKDSATLGGAENVCHPADTGTSPGRGGGLLKKAKTLGTSMVKKSKEASDSAVKMVKHGYQKRAGPGQSNMQVRAKFEYKADAPGELSFSVGDVFEVFISSFLLRHALSFMVLILTLR